MGGEWKGGEGRGEERRRMRSVQASVKGYSNSLKPTEHP